jgi:Neutral/alkaline non-lysosomal ceramidase.
MKFGIAKEIITPYFKTNMIGFAPCFGREFESIHDDIYARTLVLEDDNGNRLVLISLDLLFHDFSLTQKAQEFVSRVYGMPGDNVFIVYTHTHYGPSVKGYDLWHYSERYEEFLFERLTICVSKAFINMVEGSMQYNSVEGDWNISRRKMVDGECLYTPNPAGEKDNGLYIMKLVDCKGNIRAMLFNYSCHPSTMSANKYLSAEYPGRLCDLIESRIYGCTAIFFQGAGADTKLRNSTRGGRFIAGSFNDVDEAATAMADSVQRVLLEGSFIPIELELGAKQFIIPLPLEAYPKSFFESELAKYEKVQNYDLLVCCAKRVIESYDSMPDEIGLQGGVIRLNKNMAIFTMGGEPSFDVKVTLQKAFPEKNILFFGYCDSIAYVPSDRIIEEGGYEAEGSVTEYKLKGRIKPGVNELFQRYYTKALAIIGL